MQLFKITRSHLTNKKYAAIFDYPNGRSRTVHFGDNRYEDYTQHHNKDRRERYYARHRKEMRQRPDTPGILSLYILWGPSTNIRKNIEYYRKKFNL